MMSALKYPEDFDGILAGAPAVNLQHLLGWSGMISRAVGAPEGKSSPSYVPNELWDLVSEEILRRCDALDGRVDGIVSEPDECEFDPGMLLCGAEGHEEAEGERCLSEVQVQALRRIYSPLVGSDGETVLYPRFDPGAERTPLRSLVFAPQMFAYTTVRSYSTHLPLSAFALTIMMPHLALYRTGIAM